MVSFVLSIGVILRPGFIYGTRAVGSMKLPLGVIGTPFEMVNSLNYAFDTLQFANYFHHRW